LIVESARHAASHAGFLPAIVAVAAFYAILRGLRDSPWRLALLALPGTFAHEAAHYVAGMLLGAQPFGFTVWPRRQGQWIRLGAVSFRNVGLLNGAWVALAPLALLPLAVLAFTHALLPLWDARQWIAWLAAAYVTGTLLHAALPSWQDLRLGAHSIALYALVAIAVWLALR
jgi:hypothetical protein